MGRAHMTAITLGQRPFHLHGIDTDGVAVKQGETGRSSRLSSIHLRSPSRPACRERRPWRGGETTDRGLGPSAVTATIHIADFVDPADHDLGMPQVTRMQTACAGCHDPDQTDQPKLRLPRSFEAFTYAWAQC